MSKSGKALYVGLSNYDGPTLERACAILNDLKCPFIINQNRYSIFDRTIEKNGLKDTARRLQRGIIAFSPLAQGMLTDRYLNGIPADSRIATDGRFLKETALTPERLSQIRALNELAKKRGQTLAEMALSWILKDGDVTSVLIGASRPNRFSTISPLSDILPLRQKNSTRSIRLHFNSQKEALSGMISPGKAPFFCHSYVLKVLP